MENLETGYRQLNRAHTQSKRLVSSTIDIQFWCVQFDGTEFRANGPAPIAPYQLHGVFDGPIIEAGGGTGPTGSSMRAASISSAVRVIVP